MRLRLQPAVLGNVSQRLLQTDTADPHPTHGRYLGVRSAAAPPTTTAFQSRPVYQPHTYLTPPSRTKQASSPRTPSASSTGSSRISADRIYPADSRALSTTKRSPRWIELTTPSSSPNTSGLDLRADRHGQFQLTNQGLDTNLPCLLRTNEPPFRSPSSYDFSLTTASPKRPTNKTPSLPCCCHPICCLRRNVSIDTLVKTLHRKATHPSHCGTCLNFLSREGFSRPYPSSTLRSNLTNYRHKPGPQTRSYPHSHRPTPRFRSKDH